MQRRYLPLVSMLALGGVVFGAADPLARPAMAADKPPRAAPGPWRPAAGLRQWRIWPGDAPNGTYRPQPPESVQIFDDLKAVGGTSQAVLDIAVPTMTVMPGRGRPTRTAVIVFPGGGFQKVFIDLEGTEICRWLTAKGITCIVSKYRAPGGNDFYDAKLGHQVTPAIPRALQDAQRTIRLVRSRAGALGIDSHRIGVQVCRRAAIWLLRPATS